MVWLKISVLVIANMIGNCPESPKMCLNQILFICFVFKYTN